MPIAIAGELLRCWAVGYSGVTTRDDAVGAPELVTAGPYAYWRHRHDFKPSEYGALVSDRVDYALPFGPLGRLAHRLSVQRQLQQIFDYRQKVLAKILTGAPTVK